MIWKDDDGFLEKIKDKNRFGIFLDMGVGKTSLMLALADYKFFQDVKKLLIIAPKTVSESTWQEEISKWTNFTYMRTALTLVAGTEKKRNAILDATGEYCIHVISSSLVEWLYAKRIKVGKQTKTIPNAHKPDYDMVIVDECTEFKETSTNRYKALKQLIKDRVFLLSGTPFPNILKDKRTGDYIGADELYYVFYLLGLYQRSITEFRNDFCFIKKYDQYNYRMSPEVYEALLQELDTHCIQKKLELDIRVRAHKIYCPTDKARMKTLIKEYFLETNGFERITANNKADMINKALQLANGFTYDAEGNAERFNTNKLERLFELLKKAKGNVLILYHFKEDKKLLLDNLKGIVQYSGDQDRVAWNEGKIPYLLLSPFSQKHGLNLQMGGHTIIWFGLVWSAESYSQTNARIIRRGQTKDVDIYYLMAENSFDDYVYDVLVSKLAVSTDFKQRAERLQT